MRPVVKRGPMIAAVTLLGMGLGGFADGILFHQIFQLHNMLSARYPPTSVTNLEITMFWDGVFHAGTWCLTALGLALLWRAFLRGEVERSTRTFVGGLALGWGLFNLVEGVIDHHLLHLHHVTENPDHLVWDLAFLGSGLALSLAGLVLLRGGGTVHAPTSLPSPAR